jgi:hypothetical protein
VLFRSAGGVASIIGAVVFFRVLPKLKREVRPIYDMIAMSTDPVSVVHVPVEKGADPDDLL